jgi:hypothetical protein
LQSELVGNPSEEAGDELVGELAEAEMDLLLQSGKAGGILGELFSPELLLLLKLKGVDSRKVFVFHGIGYYVLPLTSSTYLPASRRQ